MIQRLVATLLLAAPLFAGTPTIISLTPTGNPFYEAGVSYSSWTQTATYSNVSISVNVLSLGENGTGTIYLMTAIGPSATSANEIAHTTISSSSQAPTSVTAFNNLTLGPGTYYLVGDFSGNTLSWEASNNGTLASDSGVSQNSDSSLVTPIAGYPPASPFNPSGVKIRDFAVTGVRAVVVNPAPALSGWALMLAGCLLAASGLWFVKRGSAVA